METLEQPLAGERTHTPGPWKTGRNGAAVTVTDEFGNTIAELSPYGAAFLPSDRVAPHHVTKENAALIATAPQMFDALEELLDINVMEDSNPWRLADAIKAAQVAIRKAKGIA